MASQACLNDPCTKSASGKPTSGRTTEGPPKTACTPISTSTGWSLKGEPRERPSAQGDGLGEDEPLRRAGLADTIQKPAKAVGLTVDPPLLKELLDEVSDDLGKLPLLEYALKETWRVPREGNRLTLNAYGLSGGIHGAVAKRANEIFARLKPAEQDAARRLFVSLVTPGEGREDTRARALYPEQDQAIRTVVHEFSAADARLLVTGADVPAAQHMVEISHEALIREWDLLRKWIKVNRDVLRRREHIRARMREWQEKGRDT